MSVFLGGSAYKMVRDIAEGYIIATRADVQEVPAAASSSSSASRPTSSCGRSGATVVPAGDVEATQKRQRRMQRLQQAMTIANNARARLR